VHARELEQAARDLLRLRRRAVESGVLLVGATVAGASALLVGPLPAVALFSGAALEAALLVLALNGYRERIARLALSPEAYVLPEVDRYGRRLAEPRRRARLAASISRVVAEAHLPGNFYLAERVATFAREFETLARELLRPTARIEPASVVACHRLLTSAVESPLYNPRLPAQDLELALARIRAGIAR
jgi:hypothetical protein